MASVLWDSVLPTRKEVGSITFSPPFVFPAGTKLTLAATMPENYLHNAAVIIPDVLQVKIH